MSGDILGTNCVQCVCMVQCCFTSTETIRLIRTKTQDGRLDFCTAHELCYYHHHFHYHPCTNPSCLLPPQRRWTALPREDKECPFSDLASSGRVWREVPESDARSVGLRAQELCESRGGRPGLPTLIRLRFLWT